MHYQNIISSIFIALFINYTPSIGAMISKNPQLQAKRAAMRQKASQASQNPNRQAMTQADLTIEKKRQHCSLPKESFFEACITGATNDVLHSINSLINVNSTDAGYRTGLHFAASNGHSSTVKLLLKNNVDLEAEDYKIMTPLQLTCEQGHGEIARYLMKKGANVNTICQEKLSPIHYACRSGYFDIVLDLAMYGADCNKKSSLGQTPLFIACQNGYFDIVEFLTEDKTTINTQDFQHFTPLHFACYKNKLSSKIVSLLVHRGALVNSYTLGKVAPLHTASYRGNIDAVKILVANKADISMRDSSGYTALDIARQNGHSRIIKFLTKKSPNKKALIDAQEAPQKMNHSTLNEEIFTACSAGIIAFIDKCNPNDVINAQNEDGSTALHFACQHKQLPIVKLLLEIGVPINTQNIHHATPLYLACAQKNNDAVINYLLTYKNATTLHQHSTPLYAIKNKEGATALHVACGYNGPSTVKLLLKHGANVNEETYARIIPLHIACEKGSLELVIILLKSDANINSKTYQKITPLHMATLCGHTDVIEYLLKMGADTTIESIDGITALDFAYEKEKSTIVKLFEQYGSRIVSEEEAEKCGQEIFAQLNQTDQTKQPQNIIQPRKKAKKKKQQQLKTKQITPTTTDIIDDTKEQTVDTPSVALSNQSTEIILITKAITPTVTNKNSVISKETITRPLTQQPKNSVIEPEKKKPLSSNTAQTIAPTNTNNVYHLVRPKKWPRHLVQKSQKNTMYDHLNELKNWPQTHGQGLDIETLQGKLKGKLCLRVGGSRVIFIVDNANRTIIIDDIYLHHDGYKK